MRRYGKFVDLRTIHERIDRKDRRLRRTHHHTTKEPAMSRVDDEKKDETPEPAPPPKPESQGDGDGGTTANGTEDNG